MDKKLIICAGKSDYVILLPQKATELEKIAAEQLNKYIKESTKISLPVAYEGEKNISKFISVGNTAAMQSKNFEIRHGEGGFTVIEADGNLYLFGKGDCSAIWAVYEFLERAVGYKYYDKDEIKIDSVSEIDISGYDFYFTPTITHRANFAGRDIENAMGLKSYASFGFKPDGSCFWGCWDDIIMSCHNHLNIIPLDKYYDAHPEWFNDKKNELCLSNMEMRDEFFKNFIEYVKYYSTQTHFILGHQDNGDMCYCENCQKRIDEVGTGGLHMEFLNDIARRTEAWRKQNCPEREISVGMFAYGTHTSMRPPVKKVNGEIVPISDSVVAEPNTFIMFAPIGAKEHSRPITAPENEFFYRAFTYWNKICKRSCIWMYYSSFRRGMEFTDGIYIFKENIRALKEFGCEYFFVEARHTPCSMVFDKMTLFVLTQLEWNVEQDTDALINEFMGAYYKCAAGAIRKFFDYLMAYFDKVRKRTEKLTGRKFYYGMCERDVNYEGIWSLNAVYDLVLLLEEADKTIAESDYDEQIKQKLKDRIEVLRLFTVYIQLEYFIREIPAYDEARSINTYTKEKALELLEYFKTTAKKFGVKSVDGDGDLDATIAKWKREINYTARNWENKCLIDWHKKLDELNEEYKF